MAEPTTIELGGIIFADRPVESSPGRFEGWYFQDLDNWYSLTESKSSPDERPQGHGSFYPEDDYRAAAAPSFTAFYIGRDHAEAAHAAEQLAGWGALRGRQPMTVVGPIGRRTRWVSIRSAEIPDGRDGKTIPPFRVITLSPDPLKYGPSVEASTGLPVPGGGLNWPLRWPLSWGIPPVSGRISIRNTGTAETYPMLTASNGGMTLGMLLSVVGSGQRLRLEYPILDGQKVEFNGRTRRVTVDGVDRTGFLTEYEWWSIPAGGSMTVQFKALGVVSGSPRLMSFTQPAYF